MEILILFINAYLSMDAEAQKGKKSRMINVAVMGYGTVGSGVVEVLRTNGELINERAQDVINVKYVLDLRDFPGDPVEEILTHDFETIVNDAEVDIVVETMGA